MITRGNSSAARALLAVVATLLAAVGAGYAIARLIGPGQLHAGYAGDLVGNQCPTPLGA